MHERNLVTVWLAAVLALFCQWLPATAHAREVVAEIFGQPIHRDEAIDPETLGRLIVGPLMQRFVATQRLEATDAEIAELQAWFEGVQAPGTHEPTQPGSEAGRQHAREPFAAFVRDWKLNKALYEQFGGEVIWQQFTPLEAVGAARRFLEDQEAAGAFKIFDVVERERFYAYYRRNDHPGGFIPPEKVDFSTPWWRQNPPRR